MSLKSYLNGKSELELLFQDIVKGVQPTKKEFKTVSGKVAFTNEFECKAPNNLSVPIYSTTVGTAFDYLARFMVAQKIQEGKDNAYEIIVAEHFFDKFEGLLPTGLFCELKQKYKGSIDSIKDFIYSDKVIDKNLIYDACFLARLESSWRSGMLPEDIYSLKEPAYLEIVDDLVCIVNVFKNGFLAEIVKEDSVVLFNPKFGHCSFLIGGADADIYIDGVLYDFKTTKKSGYVGKDVQQVMGYYLLSRVCTLKEDIKCSFAKVFNDGSVDFKPIKRVAIYMARFGEVAYVDIDTMDSDKLDSSVESMFVFFTAMEEVMGGVLNDNLCNRVDRMGLTECSSNIVKEDDSSVSVVTNDSGSDKGCSNTKSDFKYIGLCIVVMLLFSVVYFIK